jgi:hypothetical protein
MTKEQLIEILQETVEVSLPGLDDVSTTRNGLRIELEDGSAWQIRVEELKGAVVEEEEDEDLDDDEEDDDE